MELESDVVRRCGGQQEKGGGLLGDTSGVDDNVRSAELLDDGIHGALDGGLVTHIYVVECNGNAGLSVKSGCGFVSKVLTSVEEDNGSGTGFNTGAGHVVTQATSSTRYFVSEFDTGEINLAKTYPVTMTNLPIKVKDFMVVLSCS